MNVSMEGADALLQAAGRQIPNSKSMETNDDNVSSSLSPVNADLEDTSSLLSDDENEEEEDKEDDRNDRSGDSENNDESETMEQDEDEDDQVHDSAAETEHDTPEKSRPHKNIIYNNGEAYEQSPSKLNNQIVARELQDDEDDQPVTDDELSDEEEETGPATAPTSLDSTSDSKLLLSAADAESRKRKRSIMAGSGLDDDPDEPLRKRTGSVMTPGDEYAIEEEGETSNPMSGNISGDEGGEPIDEEVNDVLKNQVDVEDDAPQAPNVPASPKRRGRKKKKVQENDVHMRDDPDGDVESRNRALNGDGAQNGEEPIENEGDDEAEAAQKNEEELERKRLALEALTGIEDQFSTFRDRLYNDRLEQLNSEEAMLRQIKPTHLDYIAMMQCIDARRDEKIHVANKQREFEFETLKTYAVAKRSQILIQYQQEVRELRENFLEQLGKQWYEIQHDRRSYAGSVPDYSLKFPTRKSQQLMNQMAYNYEVSIISGVAKYVGFPAAPPMASATSAEMEEDFDKMGRTRQIQQAAPAAALPLHELAALRTAGSTSRFKPAEEQFIEQTPWANPQHPSHAHLLQRQSSAQQSRTSPLSQVQVLPRRHSHQHSSIGPVSGTFLSKSSSNQKSNGLGHSGTSSGDRISPQNPFSNSNPHTMAPSPIGGSRQPSLSPRHSLPPTQSDTHQNPLSAQGTPKANGKQQLLIDGQPTNIEPQPMALLGRT